ncbi:trypsin-like peptidase domain-containing protein [Adhaeretor mobilis]|uniref:Thioredoxin n=1 Tax=Adhaeretor mobilis TaxID=1930276 RepID=A0A517MR63_9BACT|nr:trypsin-like peptidase domain-containing protein [Adhaeretor mobilis]QDS97371.1 Thioredoxin [Adhaeretor mobilis]
MVRCTASLLLTLLTLVVSEQAQAQNPAPGVVMLEFSSASCGPCRSMRPKIRQLKNAGYQIEEIDVNSQRDLTERYRVSSLPTFITVVDGREHGRLVGATTQVQLQEMIHKTARAAASNPARQEQAAGLMAVDARGRSADASNDQPMPGRVVPTQPPRSEAPPSHARQASNQRAVPQRQGNQPNSVNTDKLIAATVRLTVEDAEGQSTGTGTVVDSRDGAALILTCGHIFRDSQGKGPIQITFFQPGPTGAVAKETLSGELIDFDLERDLALVSVWTKNPVAVAAVASTEVRLQKDLPVTTVGCSKGANPTAINTRVTAIDRYQGAPNVEAAGAPVEGRSGGGMFNAAGQLVGVCFAADHEGDEGLYASLDSIYSKLDELQLSMIYQSPATGNLAAEDIADASSQTAPLTPLLARDEDYTFRGQTPAELPAWPSQEVPANDYAATSGAGHPVTSFERTGPPVVPTAGKSTLPGGAGALSAVEQAALQEIQQRGAQSEVVCIIRPKTPGGKSQVITLDNASEAFVGALEQRAASVPARH